MGATFTKVSATMGSIKGGYQTATEVNGHLPADEGFILRRKIDTADLYRSGKGLTSFTDSAGDRIAAASLSTTNGSDVLQASGDPFLVQANEVHPDPVGSGIWKEIILAIRYGEWEQWESNPTT